MTEAAPGQRLRYSQDSEPGYARVRRGERFAYRNSRGLALTEAEAVKRIRSLGIPPAWTDVWICADANGHLQATGHDVKGRKQYRYHPKWRAARDAGKFDKLTEFGEALPAIRARVREHLKLDGLPREKVLAMIVRLLERTAIRVGNERYARENNSFGLTTMRNRHVKVRGPRIEFEFKGKSGKLHRVAIDDPRLARLVQHCRDLPGQDLFQYHGEDGEVRSIGSTDVNDYLREVSGREVTAKDFRTWLGSVSVCSALARAEKPDGRDTIKAAVEDAARQLGNTPAICRKSYVHPSVLTPALWYERIKASKRSKRYRGLREDERLLMNVLRVAAIEPEALLKASLKRLRKKKEALEVPAVV